MELVCSDPNAKIFARNLKTIIAAFGLLPAVGRTMLARHGIDYDNLADDVMVPLQSWLSTLGDMRELVGRDAVRFCGRKIVSAAEMPPGVALEALLENLNAAYYMNHSGDAGHYASRRVDEQTIEIDCSTPYPPELEQGLIEGFARNRKLAGRHRYDVELKPGDGRPYSCHITVRRRSTTP